MEFSPDVLAWLGSGTGQGAAQGAAGAAQGLQPGSSGGRGVREVLRRAGDMGPATQVAVFHRLKGEEGGAGRQRLGQLPGALQCVFAAGASGV